MKRFIQRHGQKIVGVLSGFDRMRFRGSFTPLTTAGGLLMWLWRAGVLLKDFKAFAQDLTDQIRRATEAAAVAAGRPVRYLNGFVNKEALVQQIRAKQGAAASGLIAVLSAVEGCRSYEVQGNRKSHRIELRGRSSRCLHYYFYWLDKRSGLTHVRLQTWFPFHVHVLLNGREWLAAELDRAGIGYLRRDNCFADIEDFARAQKLADRQPRIAWPKQLDRLLRRAHPIHRRLSKIGPVSLYWTSEETEWATDLAFRDAKSLSQLYDTLLHRGIESFGSTDVLRFLGHRVQARGGVPGRFAGEVVSDLKRRPQGLRIKHRVGRNTLKMYDKQGTVLRVETTLNDPRGLKVYRRKQGEPRSAPLRWLPLRKGVADLARRAQLSQASNERYLEALAAIDVQTPLKQLTDKLCRPVRRGGRRHRGLRPFEPDEARLLEIITRGEHQVAGFRNRDVRAAFYGRCQDAADRRRQSAAITRKFALLRAHGLIKKVPRTHRYLLTTRGAAVIPALLAARNASPAQLTAA
jgi:hypothetical protein